MSKNNRRGNNNQSQQKPQQQPPPPSPPPPRTDRLLIGTEQRGQDGRRITRKVIETPEKK